MTTVADRYARLSQAYVQLSDRFQKLDVEYMTLKTRLLPVLKAVQVCKHTIDALKKEKADLKEQLQVISEKYEALKSFEVLLDPELLALLAEAEEQIFLVEQTIQEQEADPAPDLDETEKQLLLEYQNEPEKFLSPSDLNGSHAIPSPSVVTS